MKLNYFITFLTLISVLFPSGQVFALQTSYYKAVSESSLKSFDENINDIVEDSQNHRLYVVGDFHQYGDLSGSFAPVSKTTGELVSGYPSVDGNVLTSISDGSGGVYIGGLFTKVGGVSISNVAHIKSDKTLDTSWTPNPNGFVYSLYATGTSLYIGGSFTQMGGQTRNRLAQFDLISKTLSTWNPDINKEVYTITSSGNNLYVGGDFTAINGTARNRLASFDINNFTLNTFNPNANKKVWAIAADGDTVYAGGEFDNIFGATYKKIAQFNNTTGAVNTTWKPDVLNGNIRAIAFDSTYVYIGGTFQIVSGFSVGGFAKLLKIDGNPTVRDVWPEDNSAGFRTLVMDGNYLYFGGNFNYYSADNSFRHRMIGRYNTLTDKIDTTWVTASKSIVNTILPMGGEVYVGAGENGMIGGKNAKGLAIIDTTTNALIPFDAKLNNNVNSVALSGDKLYIGGDFTNILGQSKNRIASINTNTLTLNSFNADADGTVSKLIVSGQNLYLAGSFFTVNGSGMAGFTVMDKDTAVLNPIIHDVQISGPVTNMLIDGNTAYLVGGFNSIEGNNRGQGAAISLVDGSVLSWDPATNNQIFDIFKKNNDIYISGDFTQVGTTTRKFIAAVDPVTAYPTSFSLSPDSYVTSAKDIDDYIYIAGNFMTLLNGSTISMNLGAVKSASSTVSVLDWSPVLGLFSYGEIYEGSDSLYIVGSFRDNDSMNIARFMKNASVNIPTLITPLNNATVAQATTTLSAKYLSPTIGDTGYVRFRVSSSNLNDCKLGNSIVYSGTSTLTLSNNESASVDAYLPSSGTYSWCTQNTDGYFSSPWTEMGTFSFSASSNNNSGGSSASKPSGGTLTGTPIEIVMKNLGLFSGSSTATTSKTVSGGKYIFKRNMKVGTIGDDVKELQKFLNNHKYYVSLLGAGSIGNETTIFGSATKKALVKFQEAFRNDVLAPNGLLKGTGIFGETTRNFINTHDFSK